MALAVVGNSQIWWLLKTGGLQRLCEKSKNTTPSSAVGLLRHLTISPPYKSCLHSARVQERQNSGWSQEFRKILTTLCLVQVSYTVHAHCVSLKFCVNIQLIFNARHWELSSSWGVVLQFYCDTVHLTRRLYKNQRTARTVSRIAHSHTYPTPKPEALWAKS